MILHDYLVTYVDYDGDDQMDVVRATSAGEAAGFVAERLEMVLVGPVTRKTDTSLVVWRMERYETAGCLGWDGADKGGRMIMEAVYALED
jgi:RES domain-containing protein